MDAANYSRTKNKILSDPELRKIYHETLRRRRSAMQDQAVVKQDGATAPRRTKAEFWQMLGHTPGTPAKRSLPTLDPAEAWMTEHPTDINQHTAPTYAALTRLVRIERLRFKAS